MDSKKGTPRELSMALTAAEARYTGEAGKKYASRQFDEARTDILGKCFHERSKSWLTITDRILEFGCGNGRNLLAIESVEKAGYDLNEYSRVYARQAGLRIFDRLDDIPRKYWTVVLCNHVLEHVPHPIKTLELLRNFLSPNGTLVLTVPLEGHLLKLKRSEVDCDHHLFCWNPTTMRNLLAASGYRMKELVIRRAACESRLRRLDLISWRLFRLGVWVCGLVLRRREMSVIAEPIESCYEARETI